ncbi:recombinase family protein [Nonomuraea turkmeniaca]|uniref:Recombinase family protein n=1 Tax=Nonomuraea turkmeniaca TaxID=103838 RepID=A0A5S4F4K2_9ACTN|nr:recombinase family protein [Nonomuraea turkmeniaca]TMR11076.1 recombinase family protein [Nonomuraea turkmeniaca]
MRPLCAILLLRISDDRSGEAAGVGRQDEDGRRLAERLGWTLGPDETHVIVENDTSAFKRRKIRLPDGTFALRTVRPGFRRGLDMLATGTADGLLAYDLDRAARDPRDLEDLIDVVESKHPRIPAESVTGSLRLANDADVTMARVMVAIANKSSRDTARRVTRKHEELATQGRPGGGGIRPFGYEKDGTTIQENEADVIKWMAREILDGGTLFGVAAQLNERGVRPVRAQQWNSRSVWSILTGPRIAGLRRFRGAVVGDATWPAILDRDTWDAVRAQISERGSGHNNQLTRWLTGTLWCSLCGHELTNASATKHVGPRYWCSTPRGGCGKIAITAIAVEDLMSERIVEYLSDPDAVVRLLEAISGGTADQTRTQLAEDEAQLKDLARMWATRRITLAEYTEARDIIEDRVRNARAFTLSSAPRVLRYLLEGDVQSRWDGLAPKDRRVVVQAILPNGFKVLPHPKDKPRRFDPDRLVPR